RLQGGHSSMTGQMEVAIARGMEMIRQELEFRLGADVVIQRILATHSQYGRQDFALAAFPDLIGELQRLDDEDLRDGVACFPFASWNLRSKQFGEAHRVLESGVSVRERRGVCRVAKEAH